MVCHFFGRMSAKMETKRLQEDLIRIINNQCWKTAAIQVIVCLVISFAIPPLSHAYEAAIYSYKMSLKSQVPRLLPGQSIILPLRLANTSGREWLYTSKHPIRLSYHWLTKKGDVVVWDGERSPVPQKFREGILRAKIKAPEESGNYILEFDLVHEYITWFAQSGASPLQVEVIVEDPATVAKDRDLIRREAETAWWSDLDEINQIQTLIKTTFESNTNAFIGFSGPVLGFTAGSAYQQLWIRDLATIIPMARYYYDKEFLGSWIDEHLYFQNNNGSIYDWIDSRGACDKNSVESDQESSLIIAAYTYYSVTRDKKWLQERIQKLESALYHVLNNRRDDKTNLIWSGYTADWGDVSPVYKDQRSVYYDSTTPKVIGLYTNAIFCRAAQKLALLFNVLENDEKYKKWRETAETWTNRIEANFWSENFYRMHCYILSPDQERLNISYSIFPLGGNAEAMLAGIPNRKQVRAIYTEAKQRQKKHSITTIGAVVLPPFPRDFFKHPVMKEPFSYQNGGQWDWFAGRFILGLFRYGFVEEALSELIALAKKVVHNKTFYEWDTRQGVGRGSPHYAGGAAVVGQAIVEGLFGISREREGWSVKIYLGTHEGEIKVIEPCTNSSIYYRYIPRDDRIDLIVKAHKPNKKVTLKIWKPDGPWKDLFINGSKVKYLRLNDEGDWYYAVKRSTFDIPCRCVKSIGWNFKTKAVAK